MFFTGADNRPQIRFASSSNSYSIGLDGTSLKIAQGGLLGANEYFTGEYVVNLVNETDLVPTDKPFEVKHGGTGFMLIKREVFEKLKDKCPSYIHNMNDTNDNSDLGDKITEYFATSIDENNHLLSEDYHFCKLARDNGIKVHGAALRAEAQTEKEALMTQLRETLQELERTKQRSLAMRCRSRRNVRNARS